jgi:hypothetical protein
MYMHNVHQVFFARIPPQQKQNGSMLQLMLDKENNIYKGQKKYPWSEATSFWKKRQSKEIS